MRWRTNQTVMTRTKLGFYFLMLNETALKWKMEYTALIAYNKHTNPKFFVRIKVAERKVSAYVAGHAFFQYNKNSVL